MVSELYGIQKSPRSNGLKMRPECHYYGAVGFITNHWSPHDQQPRHLSLQSHL